MFSGGVLAPNGHLYFVPCYADYIGFIDTNLPVAQWRVTAIETGQKEKWKWRGGVVALNEKIYFVPERADFIGVVNSVERQRRKKEIMKLEEIIIQMDLRCGWLVVVSVRVSNMVQLTNLGIML